MPNSLILCCCEALNHFDFIILVSLSNFLNGVIVEKDDGLACLFFVER